MAKFRMPSQRKSLGGGRHVTRNAKSYSYSSVFKPTKATTVTFTSGPRGPRTTTHDSKRHLDHQLHDLLPQALQVARGGERGQP